MDHTDETDETLVLLVAQGDRAAATVLIDRHTNKIYARCYRMLRNKAAAEDATQEVFLRLWKNAASWNAQATKFEAWLYRIATNYCLDQLRKTGREVSDEGMPEMTDGAAGPAEIVAAKQHCALVRKALYHLPDRQRMAIALCYLQELPNVEAAEIMGISVPAIESILARARRRLREHFTPLKRVLFEEAGDDAIRNTG